MKRAKAPTQEQRSVDLTDMDIDELIAFGYPFQPAPRVSAQRAADDLYAELEDVCCTRGTPYVISHCDRSPHWKRDRFSIRALTNIMEQEKDERKKELKIKNHTLGGDEIMTMLEYKEYLKQCQSSKPPRDKKYAKDVSAPNEWREMFKNILPTWLQAMGPNDMMSAMPSNWSVESMLLYIGPGGTWTAGHYDQCATTSHNIMVHADHGAHAIWFMIRPCDFVAAKKLWSSFGHSIDMENYCASVQQLKAANFPIYVVKQQTGDLVIAPSLCVHQVINMGGASIKVAWNRSSALDLERSMKQVLPVYRIICRPEAFRTQLTVMMALDKMSDVLSNEKKGCEFPYGRERFARDYMVLLRLFRTCIDDDRIDFELLHVSDDDEALKPTIVMHELPATCDFCKTDIWNTLFHCSICTLQGDGQQRGRDLCLYCYALGRSCPHPCEMMPIQTYPTNLLLQRWWRATLTWNQSKMMPRTRHYKEITKQDVLEKWPRSKYSIATIAYSRFLCRTRVQHLDEQQQATCHQCQQPVGTQTRMRCSVASCDNVYCETCMFRGYKQKWSRVMAKKGPHLWACYACREICTCASCKSDDKESEADDHEWLDPGSTDTVPALTDPPFPAVDDNSDMLATSPLLPMPPPSVPQPLPSTLDKPQTNQTPQDRLTKRRKRTPV